jgi:predicted RNA methylase
MVLSWARIEQAISELGAGESVLSVVAAFYEELAERGVLVSDQPAPLVLGYGERSDG